MSALSDLRSDGYGSPAVTVAMHGKPLIDSITNLGGTVPPELAKLVEAQRLIDTYPVGNRDHIGEALAEATTAGFTRKKLDEAVAAAARQAGDLEARRDLASRGALILKRQFADVLRNGGANRIIESLRPQFDATAAEVVRTAKAAALHLADADLVSRGTAANLEARQELVPLVNRLDRIVGGVCRKFAPNGEWPLWQWPRIGLGDQMSSRAAYTVSAERMWDISVLWHRHQAARTPPLAASPWLAVDDLHLNNIDEVIDNLRRWSERNWRPGPDHHRPNPYILDGYDTTDPDDAQPGDLLPLQDGD